ncbi:hypothetical protein AC781_11375 [Akkermansia glycaniphila]|nr:hypothetical protein AC781_11375 [Akkermansia glycaniphila]
MTIDEQAGPNTAVFTGFNAERSGLVEHSVDLDNLDAAGYGALFNAGRDGFFSAEGAATPMARFEDQMMFREGWDPREKAERERVDAVSQKAEVLFLDPKEYPGMRWDMIALHGEVYADEFLALSEEDRQHVAVRYIKDSVYGAGDAGYARMAEEYGMPFSMNDAEWFSVLGQRLKQSKADRQRVDALNATVEKEKKRIYREVISGKSANTVYESISDLDPEVQVHVYEVFDFARARRESIDTFLDDVFPEKSVAVGMEGLKNEAWRPSDLSDLAVKLVKLKKRDQVAYDEVLKLIQEGVTTVKENPYEGESLGTIYLKHGIIPLDAILEKSGFLRQIGATLGNVLGSTADLIEKGMHGQVVYDLEKRVENGSMTQERMNHALEKYDRKYNLSQEEMEVRNDLLGMVRDMQTSSTRKDLFYGEWRDTLAQGMASTLTFQASPWLMFGSRTNDRMDELIADGSSGGNALLRGMLIGGVEVGSEFMFGIGKVTRWGGPRAGKLFKEVAQTKAVQAALKYPLALKAATGRAFRLNKLWGYASGAKIAWSRAHYGSAMLRYGVATGRAGLGEMVEEYAGILAGVPGDYYLAMMLGEDNATSRTADGGRRTLSQEVYRQCADLTLDTGTWFSMMAMGGMFAGANLGRYRRDAMWMTTKPKNLQAMGLTEEQAVEVANTVKPEEKFQLGRRYLADNQRKSVDELMQNVRVGFTSMEQDMEWVEDLAGYEDAVENGMLPRAERMEDGKWKMTMRVRNEAGELVEAAPFMLDDKTATGYMQTLFENEFMRGELMARDNMVANAMVGKLKTDENWKVRDMGQADTQESMERLAVMARIRMDKAAADKQYMVSQIVDPAVDADLTLGQAARMGEAFGERVKLEKMRDAEKLSRERSLLDEARLAAGQERFTNEEWDAYADRHIYSSAANRTRMMDSGKTLLRYAAGEIGAMDVMEEVIEDEFERSKRDGRSLGWWAGHFRALQKEMGMANAFLPDSGNVTEAQVTEAVSKMVKSDLLARSEKLNISDWLKAFLRMLARMMRRAHALCKLGKMFNDLHAAGKLNKDFVRSIHEFTGRTAEYFKDLQVKTAAEVHGKAVAAASTAYAAPALKEMGLAAAAAEEEDGMAAVEQAAAPAPEEDAVVKDMATAVQEEVNAQGIEGARRTKDPLAMAAAVREAGLDAAGLKAHGLESGSLGKAARVGALAGEELYRAVLAGGVPMKAAERLAAAAPRNEDLQKVGMEELERGVKAAVATMQATAALGEGATREDARRAAEYVQRKMRALERRLIRESDAMNEDFDPDAVMKLKESIEQVRNWPAFREVVEQARAWDGKSRVDGSPLTTAGTTFSLRREDDDSQFPDAGQVAAAWKGALDAYFDGKTVKRTADMKVCPTPSVLRMLGAKAHDMVITPGVIDKVMKEKHAVTREAMERIPDAVASPLAVFQSVASGNSLEVLTELKEGDDHVLVVVHLNAKSAEQAHQVTVNRIMSVYGKENVRALFSHPMLYADIKKARPLLVSHGLQLPGQAVRKGSGNKIHTPADLVKWKEKQRMPGTSFSVRGDFGLAEELLVPSQKVRGHEVLTRTIHEDIQRCIELWNRYDNLAADEREKAIVAIGSAMHLAQAVAGSLPSKYRFSLNPYLKKMQVFAELAATGDLDFTRDLVFTRDIIFQKTRELDSLRGKIDEGELEEMVKEYGERRLHEVVAHLLKKTDERLNRWGRDCVIVEIDRLLDRVKPQVDSRTMRQKKGLLSAAGYRRLQEIDKLMSYTQEEKEEALGVLEGAVQKAKDAGTASELADAEDRLAELALFGALHDMTMEQAAAVHAELSSFIQKERFAWDEVRDMRQARTRRILGKAIRLFGGRPSFNAVNLAKHRKSTLKDALTMDGVLLSMPHILQQLRKYPALEGLAGLMQARQAAAFQGIAAARRQRVEQVHALAKQYLGKKNWKAMNRLKEVHKTGISLQRIRMERVEIASQMVDVWLNKTPEEREAYRQEQEEAAAKADEKPTSENMEKMRTIPTERDVEELARWRKERDAREAVYRRELNEYEKATDEMRKTMKKPRPPKADNLVRLEYEGEMETVENFETSKDTALYIILMSEQAEYAGTLARQGFDAETIGKLKEWIGQDVLQFGYELRKLFKEQGDRIAAVYEATYGVPFPRVENYFAARFDVARMKSAEAEILQGMGAMQGGGKGFMKVRTFHNHDLDLRRGALSVFMEATEISDNWMFTQDIVSDWRAFLSDQDFANVLAVHLGEELYERLRRWVSMIETMGVRGAMSLGAADRVIGKLYGAKANAVLGFKLETMLRQTSAVLNGWAGDPSIGFAEWMKAMAMIRGKKTPMTVEKMLASPEMQTRFGGQLGLAERQMMLPTGEKANAVESMLQAGMSPMEYIDMRLNAMSMTAVYYVHYNRAKAKGMSEADCDLAGWAGVHGSIDMAAQPQNWMQKSELWNRLPSIAKPVLFMMSENINKAGLCLSLFRSGQYKKSVQVWFAYGILNTLVGILLDFIRDDPDEWEKRDWLGYVFAAAFGPLNGIPLVGEMLEGGVDYLLKLADIDMGVYVGSAGRGVVDLGGTRRAVEKMIDMMDGDKEGDFGEYVKQSIRLSSSVGVIGGAFGGTVGSAMLLGSALMNPVKTVTNFIHSRGWDD